MRDSAQVAEPLAYQDLDMTRVEARFTAEGELWLALPAHHARACIDFIQLIHAMRRLRRDRVPLLRRLGLLAGGWVLLLRILLRHRRLFELARVLVLWSASKEWQARPDGSYLFGFARQRPDLT